MQKTNTPVLAGTLSIISGALGFIGGLFFIAMIFFFGSVIGSSMNTPDDELGIKIVGIVYGTMGAIGIILAVFAIIGGVFALRRTHWGWALTGSIISTVLFFPTGIPAIVFTVLSRGEFASAPRIEPPPVTTAPTG